MSTDAKVIWWEEVPERLYSRSRIPAGEGKKILHVDWSREFLRFSVYPGGIDCGEIQVPGGTGSIAHLLDSCAEILDGFSSKRYLKENEKKSAWNNLRAAGQGLFELLLPPELQARVLSWPDQTFLLISTNEQWIPWELLHDTTKFLGERMLVVRLPRIPSRAAVWGEGQRLSAPRIDCGRKVLNVIGGGLVERVEECKSLFLGFDGKIEIILLHEEPLATFTEALQGTDLVHITCHGHRDPRLMLQIHRTDDQALNLLVDSVGAEDFRLKPGCLVYANACNSAAAEFKFGEFVGFAWKFYAKGAAAFIGTLGTVPTQEAIDFARRFYSRLATEGSDDVYKIYQDTKLEAICDGPACLFFCISGNPDDALSFKAIAKGGKKYAVESSGSQLR